MGNIENENIRHLGDGIYAGFDGYHIVLRVNDHRNEPVAHLDFDVMQSLIEYFEKTKQSIKPVDHGRI